MDHEGTYGRPSAVSALVLRISGGGTPRIGSEVRARDDYGETWTTEHARSHIWPRPGRFS